MSHEGEDDSDFKRLLQGQGNHPHGFKYEGFWAEGKGWGSFKQNKTMARFQISVLGGGKPYYLEIK